MSRNLNAPNLSALGGRPVAVRIPRVPGAGESFVPGVIEIRDVAGDQDGPAVVVVLDRKAAATHSLPHTIALNTVTVARFLAASPDLPLELMLD